MKIRHLIIILNHSLAFKLFCIIGKYYFLEMWNSRYKVLFFWKFLLCLFAGCSSSPWFDGFGLQWWFDSHFEVNFVRCSPARFFHIFILKEALIIIIFVIMALTKAQKWYIYAGYFTTSSWSPRSERFS